MLVESSTILHQISQWYPERSFNILADTQYGSCCVDEVAAEHANVDLIIHFGEACLSRPSRIPVFFIFDECKHAIDGDLILDSLTKWMATGDNDINRENVTLICDLKYHDIILGLVKNIDRVHVASVASKFVPISVDPCGNNSDQEFLGRLLYKDKDSYSPENDVILYFGDCTRLQAVLNMQFYGIPLYNMNPVSCEISLAANDRELNRYLFKRYAGIEKAKESDIIGILVGTLGVADYASIIKRLRRIITAAEKKPYVIVVGKLNPAKLANFAEIPLFVLVSCPMNTFIDETKDYYQTIITPYELEVAVGQREWDPSKYHVSFSGLLKDEEESTTSVELQGSNDQSMDLIPVNGDQALTLSRLDYHISSRSWNGLDLQESQKPIELASDGRRGIAKSYGET